MRYRLMATYDGSPFEAGIGPTADDIVLFAACPPPEELGFEPATGHWRKQVRFADVQAVWESRPVGVFRGERCLVLDDLGDRLHIGYLGHDGMLAERLGYWQVDRGVFELIAPRSEVTDILEERLDVPGPEFATPAAAAEPAPLPVEAEAMRAATSAISSERRPAGATLRPASSEPPAVTQITPAAPARQHRAARRRLDTERLFADLADLAGIPADSYAVGEEVDGAMCLIGSEQGFEVFLAAGGARHELQTFATEEAACFYLFGVLAAEEVRTGALARVRDVAANWHSRTA